MRELVLWVARVEKMSTNLDLRAGNNGGGWGTVFILVFDCIYLS